VARKINSGYYIKVNNLDYNVYSNDLSLLCKVFNKKKRLNVKKKDTLLKFLYLEA